MANVQHNTLGLANAHVTYAWTYADAAARTGATGFVSADAGKFARQLDNDTVWMLLSTAPTWKEISMELGTGSAQAAPGNHTAHSTSADVTGRAFAPSGLTGAIAATRYAGGTIAGAPASGTFIAGDFVIDQTGQFWFCTAGGTPGTWVAGAGISQATADGRYLRIANNLSDLGSAATARTNLGLGTAATKNTPASGDAASGEAVLGSDMRLSDARTPSAHRTSHEVSGSDALAGRVPGQTFEPSGLTGATQASRYVGATASGAPASGTFAVGDYVIARTGKLFVCTTAGSPGTWTQAGGAGSSSLTIQEVDGSPGGNPATLKVTNGTLTDNGDGSFTLAIAGGGAPTGAKYLVAEADATLSAEIPIAGLLFPHQAPASPNTQDDEFIATSLDAKWTATTGGTAPTWDVHTTIPSMVMAKFGAADGSLTLQQAYAPAGAFSLTAKLHLHNASASSSGGGIQVFDSGETNGYALGWENAGLYRVTLHELNSSTWTFNLATFNNVYTGALYLHIQRGAANDWSFYWSLDGISFARLTTRSKTFTVHHLKLVLQQGGSTVPARYAIDWIRRDWLTL